MKTHVSRILAELALRDRTRAVVAAYESGLVGPGFRDWARHLGPALPRAAIEGASRPFRARGPGRKDAAAPNAPQGRTGPPARPTLLCSP